AFLALRDDEPGARRRDWRLAAMHLGAAAIVALWILRNALTFGFPSIATGVGQGLFLGINPVVNGFEPTYYGLDYDVGAVTGGKDHLTLESDRLLTSVFLVELRDTPPLVLAEMAVHKVGAFVFVSAAAGNSGQPLAPLRARRVAFFVLALVALRYRRHSRVV